MSPVPGIAAALDRDSNRASHPSVVVVERQVFRPPATVCR
jgi:hypothetical protein